MARTLRFALAVMLAALLVGCAAGAVVVTGEDDGGRIEVAPGRVLEVRLAGNATTGYSWAVTGSPAPQLTLLEEEYVPDEPSSGVVGSGGTFVLRFEAAELGENDLALVYAQPWEPSAISDTWTARIVVAHP